MACPVVWWPDQRLSNSSWLMDISKASRCVSVVNNPLYYRSAKKKKKFIFTQSIVTNHGRPDDMFMLFSILDYFTTVAVHTRLQLSRCQPDTSPTITTTLRTQYYLCRAAWWADEGPVRQLLHAYVSKKSYQSWISKVEQALLCVCLAQYLHTTRTSLVNSNLIPYYV